MATTLVEAVGSYLQTNSMGVLGTSMFVGLLPSAPDACIAIYEGDAGAPLETAGSAATAVERVELRVVVRASRDDYATARDKALTIRSLLAGITEQTLSGIRVLRISAQTWVIPAGNDDNDRPHFTVRFLAHVEP